MDSYTGAVGSFFIPDFSSYGLKDWLQMVAAVFGILGSTFGAWIAFRYSKSQMVKRLTEYLQDQDKNFDEVRHLVVNHLRNGEASVWTPTVQVHERIASAIKLAANGQHQDAERELERFAIVLMQSADVGRRHMELAKRQAATFLVFAGLIARKREESGPARRAWEKALTYNPNDAEAVRGLAELELETGSGREALKQLNAAQALVPDDKRLHGEISYTKAGFYKQRGNPNLERRALLDCAKPFEEIREYKLAGESYERAGDIETRLGRSHQARTTLRKAHACYHKTHDHVGTTRVRERLKELGDDVSDLPVLSKPTRWPSIPWPWVRLTLEVAILGAALACAV